MKKRSAKKGIAGAMLVLGLIFMGCASMGKARFDPPDGIYDSYQGSIVFDAAEGSWEAIGLGYRGSFDFNKESGGIDLNAEQELRGFRWVDIDPIQNFSAGQMKGGYITLGDFKWFKYED